MKVRFSLFLALVGQLAIAVPCQAATWREVGGFPDKGMKVFVDDASLAVDHDYIVKGWVRMEYMAPREHDGMQLSAHSSLRMTDCENGRYWVSEGWGYLPDKTDPVRLYASAQEWQVPAPDSEDEIAYRALCYEARSMLGILWDKIKQGFSRIGEAAGE